MDNTHRYRATNLRAVMNEQGRQNIWMANRLGISRSFVTMLIDGQRTVSEEVATKISTLLNLPLFLIFELSDESKTVSVESTEHAA